MRRLTERQFLSRLQNELTNADKDTGILVTSDDFYILKHKVWRVEAQIKNRLNQKQRK